jgi:predicted MPP superfamily phosphohydrolase
MNVLFVADLHYALRQFDWLVARAPQYDAIIIGGDLLEIAGALEIDVQIVVIEKYLHRLRQLTRLIVSSGNHDGDSRNASDESVARWLLEVEIRSNSAGRSLPSAPGGTARRAARNWRRNSPRMRCGKRSAGCGCITHHRIARR